MNNLPEFDVIMPVYRGDTFKITIRAIASVLNNSLQPQRFVITKDGPICTELNNYLTKLEEQCDCVLVVGTPENRGLGPALNFGLDECKSEIVFRCDADDINYANRFVRQLQALKELDADILGSQIVEEDPISLEKRIKSVPLTMEEIKKYSKLRNPINHMTVVFKKSKVLNVGGYPNIPFKEDYGLWLNALDAGLVLRNIEDVLVTARAGDSMISRRAGFRSIVSEWYLYRLRARRRQLGKLQNLGVFFIRTSILLAPANLLRKIYSVLRTRKN